MPPKARLSKKEKKALLASKKGAGEQADGQFPFHVIITPAFMATWKQSHTQMLNIVIAMQMMAVMRRARLSLRVPVLPPRMAPRRRAQMVQLQMALLHLKIFYPLLNRLQL